MTMPDNENEKELAGAGGPDAEPITQDDIKLDPGVLADIAALVAKQADKLNEASRSVDGSIDPDPAESAPATPDAFSAAKVKLDELEAQAATVLGFVTSARAAMEVLRTGIGTAPDAATRATREAELKNLETQLRETLRRQQGLLREMAGVNQEIAALTDDDQKKAVQDRLDELQRRLASMDAGGGLQGGSADSIDDSAVQEKRDQRLEKELRVKNKEFDDLLYRFQATPAKKDPGAEQDALLVDAKAFLENLGRAVARLKKNFPDSSAISDYEEFLSLKTKQVDRLEAGRDVNELRGAQPEFEDAVDFDDLDNGLYALLEKGGSGRSIEMNTASPGALMVRSVKMAKTLLEGKIAAARNDPSKLSEVPVGIRAKVRELIAAEQAAKAAAAANQVVPPTIPQGPVAPPTTVSNTPPATPLNAPPTAPPATPTGAPAPTPNPTPPPGPQPSFEATPSVGTEGGTPQVLSSTRVGEALVAGVSFPQQPGFEAGFSGSAQDIDTATFNVDFGAAPRPVGASVEREFPGIDGILNPDTGEINLTPEAQKLVMASPKFRQFIQQVPDFAAIDFSTTRGQERALEVMEQFLVRVATFEQMRAIYEGELRERLGIQIPFEDGDFGALKAFLDKQAISNPDALRGMMEQAFAYRASAAQRENLENEFVALSAKHGVPAALKLELVAATAREQATKKEIEGFSQRLTTIEQRDYALAKARRANETNATFLSKFESAKPFARLARLGGPFSRLAEMKLFDDAISDEQRTAREQLRRAYGPSTMLGDIDDLQRANQAERDALQADPAYLGSQQALDDVRKQIAELKAKIGSVEEAEQAKNRLELGVADARNMLIGEQGVFREIATRLSSEFGVTLLAGTAIPEGAAGKPRDEVAGLMTQAEFVSSLVEAENAYTPEWVASLAKELTDEGEKSIAVKLLGEKDAAFLTELGDQDTTDQRKGEILTLRMSLGAAINVLGGRRETRAAASRRKTESPDQIEKQLKDSIGREEREIEALERRKADYLDRGKTREAATVEGRIDARQASLKNFRQEQEKITKSREAVAQGKVNIQRQLDFMLRGRSGVPHNMQELRTFQGAFRVELEALRAAYARLGDEANARRTQDQLKELSQLFDELKPAEERRNRLSVSTGDESLKLPPTGFVDKAKRVIESFI